MVVKDPSVYLPASDVGVDAALLTFRIPPVYDAVAFVAPASLCGIRCPAKGMCRGGDLAVPTDYSRGGGALPIEPMTPSVGSVSLLVRPVCSATAGHSRLSGAACVCHALSVFP